MDFQTQDLKPFRIPKRTESPPKPTVEAKSEEKPKPDVKIEVKKEMPPLPTVSKRHQIASIDFETTEKSPKVTNSPAVRKKDERVNRKRQSSSSHQKQHQSAPLDNIMSEMSREIKRQKKHQEPHHEKEPKPFVEAHPILTREYLDDRAAHNDFIEDFLNREDILEKLLGHKMKYNRLEPYPNIGFRKMTELEVADEVAKKVSYFSIPGPSGEQKPTPPPMGGRRPRGPKTPPGSPGGPRTPPGPPPPLPSLDSPGAEQSKVLFELSMISGIHPHRLEDFLGAEVSKKIATMDQTTLLESIKSAIVGADKGKTPVKPPEPPRRSNDSVQMELVSDCSLSPMNGDDDDDSILAPPPPPPVIEPPPPPPTLPPIPAPPMWPPIVNTSIPPPNLPPPPAMPPQMQRPFPPPSGPPQPLMSMNIPIAPPPNTHVPPPRFSMNIPPPPPPSSTEISVSSTAEVPSASPDKPPPPAAVPLTPAVPAPPPPAQATTPAWMASTSNLPSWSDENLGDWSREDSWMPKDTTPVAVPAAPEPTMNVGTPSNEKITNTLLSALGLGGGLGAPTGPGTPISVPPVSASPRQPDGPFLDRYGCPLPVPSSAMPRGLPPPHPSRGRGRGGHRGGRGGGFQTPLRHQMSPMGPPQQQRNLRYPHMGNSPMAQPRGTPQMPRKRGAGGRAMKLPS